MKELIIRTAFKVAGGVTGITRVLNALEESQWWSPEQLQELQWQRLQETLKLAFLRIPFYRRVVKERGLTLKSFDSFSDLTKLPIVTRQMLQTDLDEFVCDNISRKALIRTATGGSTGQPTPLYHDRSFITDFRAAAIRCSRWLGWDVGKPWARIWGASADVSQYHNVVSQLALRTTNRMIIPAWDLRDSTLPQYAAALRRFSPCMLEGYTTPLHLFARFLLSQGISSIQPSGVVSSAETLYPHQRQDIQKAFSAKVYNRYGTREVGAIAHECSVGNMHIQAENLYLEFNRSGVLATPGQAGEILVTTLTNRCMPLIRYAIGDVAAASPQTCSCGRGLPLMQSLEGRVQDLLMLPGGYYLPGEFFPHLLKDFDVHEFQVRQSAIDKLTLYIVRGPSLQPQDIERLRALIAHQTGPEVHLRIELVDNIDRTKTGKWRFTISELDPSSLWASGSQAPIHGEFPRA